MNDNGRIDLAHTADFSIGALAVRPSTREVVSADGAIEILEPRVMQVLVALECAHGAIVSRDDLTHRCWEDRIVGDDAINRVISRLRRISETIGAFRIETITKVGYRLIRLDDDGAPIMAAPSDTATHPIDRRLMLATGGALAALSIGAGVWWRNNPVTAVRPPPPHSIAMLMTQGFNGMRETTPEGFAQGLGTFRRVVALAPDYADGWGALAIGYAFAAHERGPATMLEMVARSRAAAQRAFALDPDNAYARAALVWTLPSMGNWLRVERTLDEGLARHPDSDVLLLSHYRVLPPVGRMRDMAAMTDRIVAVATFTPAVALVRLQMLWATNRLEEADRISDDAFAQFPLHASVWFTRCSIFLYTGRADQALAMINRINDRPSGVPPPVFDLFRNVTTAMNSGAKADVDKAVAASVAASHQAAWPAENAIQFCSALGHVDDAFAIAEAYFFNRGYAVGEAGSGTQASVHAILADRETLMLFLPSTAAMRADPRFGPLVRALGLERYWQDSGTRPDYRL